MPQHTHRIALIPGDGIGKEVLPEGVRVLEHVASRFDIAFEVNRVQPVLRALLRAGHRIHLLA